MKVFVLISDSSNYGQGNVRGVYRSMADAIDAFPEHADRWDIRANGARLRGAHGWATIEGFDVIGEET